MGDPDRTWTSTAEDLIFTEDLEALLLDLRAQHHRCANGSASSVERKLEGAQDGEEYNDTESFPTHPSLQFYWGQRPVIVQSPAGGELNGGPAQQCLHVISLHQALLPPCESLSAESQSMRLSSSEGIELLRTNWSILLHLLFPSIQSTWSDSGMASLGNTVLESSPPSAPIVSLEELRRPLTYTDYTHFREAGATDRVHYSYVVFLRFFGWRLHDEECGVLDRHSGWRERYEFLSRYHRIGCMSEGHESYGTEDFYAAITRIVRVLLELCLTRYAVNLVSFLLEEMGKGRLLFLLQSLQDHWLSQLLCCRQVAASDKERLRRQLYRLTHSDSD